MTIMIMNLIELIRTALSPLADKTSTAQHELNKPLRIPRIFLSKRWQGRSYRKGFLFSFITHKSDRCWRWLQIILISFLFSRSPWKAFRRQMLPDLWYDLDCVSSSFLFVFYSLFFSHTICFRPEAIFCGFSRTWNRCMQQWFISLVVPVSSRLV